MFIFEKERQSSSGRRAERERETQNLKQAPGSELSAHSSMWGSNSQTVRSQSESKSDTQPNEPPRHPEKQMNIKKKKAKHLSIPML